MLPTTHIDRPDRDRARLVEAALELQTEHSPQVAAAFLTDNGFGFATVVRVLSEPERRRALDLRPSSH